MAGAAAAVLDDEEVMMLSLLEAYYTVCMDRFVVDCRVSNRISRFGRNVIYFNKPDSCISALISALLAIEIRLGKGIVLQYMLLRYYTIY